MFDFLKKFSLNTASLIRENHLSTERSEIVILDTHLPFLLRWLAPATVVFPLAFFAVGLATNTDIGQVMKILLIGLFALWALLLFAYYNFKQWDWMPIPYDAFVANKTHVMASRDWSLSRRPQRIAWKDIKSVRIKLYSPTSFLAALQLLPPLHPFSTISRNLACRLHSGEKLELILPQLTQQEWPKFMLILTEIAQKNGVEIQS